MTEVIVKSCQDCPMDKDDGDIYTRCKLQKGVCFENLEDQFEDCPLKEQPVILKLKTDVTKEHRIKENTAEENTPEAGTSQIKKEET